MHNLTNHGIKMGPMSVFRANNSGARVNINTHIINIITRRWPAAQFEIRGPALVALLPDHDVRITVHTRPAAEVWVSTPDVGAVSPMELDMLARSWDDLMPVADCAAEVWFEVREALRRKRLSEAETLDVP